MPTAPPAGGRMAWHCARRWNSMAGMARGTAGPPTITARRWARRTARPARSMPSPSPGRCCLAWATLPEARWPWRRSTSRLVRRDEGLALLFSPPFDGGVDRPRLSPGLPAWCPRERRPVQSRRDVERPGLCGAGGRGHCRRTVLDAQPDSPCADAAGNRPLQGGALCGGRRRLFGRPHVGRGGWTWYTGAADGWCGQASRASSASGGRAPGC